MESATMRLQRIKAPGKLTKWMRLSARMLPSMPEMGREWRQRIWPGMRAIMAGAKANQRAIPATLALVEPTRRERIQEMPMRRRASGTKKIAMPMVWRRRSAV